MFILKFSTWSQQREPIIMATLTMSHDGSLVPVLYTMYTVRHWDCTLLSSQRAVGRGETDKYCPGWVVFR